LLKKRDLVRFRQEAARLFLGTNTQEKRDFLRHFINRIVVEPEAIKIHYFPPDPRNGLRLVVDNEKGEPDIGSPYGKSWLLWERFELPAKWLLATCFDSHCFR